MRQVSQGIPANAMPQASRVSREGDSIPAPNMPLAFGYTPQEYNSIPAEHHLLRANNAQTMRQAMPQANAAIRGSNFGRDGAQPDASSFQRRLQNLPKFDDDNDNEIHLFKPNFIYTIDNKYCL